MHQAWTEVCRQIFGGWEVQNMYILQKNDYREASFNEKNIYKSAKHEFTTTNLNQK